LENSLFKKCMECYVAVSVSVVRFVTDVDLVRKILFGILISLSVWISIYFSCLAAYDTRSSSWTTVANDPAYASYSVLSVAHDNQLVAIGNIHGTLKILFVSSLFPLRKSQRTVTYWVIISILLVNVAAFCRHYGSELCERTPAFISVVTARRTRGVEAGPTALSSMALHGQAAHAHRLCHQAISTFFFSLSYALRVEPDNTTSFSWM